MSTRRQSSTWRQAGREAWAEPDWAAEDWGLVAVVVEAWGSVVGVVIPGAQGASQAAQEIGVVWAEALS